MKVIHIIILKYTEKYVYINTYFINVIYYWNYCTFIYLRFNDYFVEKHMMNQNSQIKTTMQNYKKRHTRILYNESKKKINE